MSVVPPKAMISPQYDAFGMVDPVGLRGVETGGNDVTMQ